MSFDHAAAYFNALKARDDILSSGGGLLDKTRQLSNWQQLVDKPAPAQRKWTIGDVVKGIFGAGLGLGVAKGVSAVLPLSERFEDKMETVAMGIGAGMNTGVIKWAQNDAARVAAAVPKIRQMRKHAFRLGFLKAAVDSGMLKRAMLVPVPVISVGVGDILSIPRAAAKALTSASRTTGSMAGTLTAVDEQEEEMTKEELDRQLLQEQLSQLQAERRNMVLKQVLARRQGRR